MNDIQRLLYEKLLDRKDRELEVLRIEVKRLTQKVESLEKVGMRKKIMRLCLPKSMWG